MSLRDACHRSAGPPPSISITWGHAAHAARSIATKWADRPVRPLPVFQLDAIVGTVRQHWSKKGHLNELTNREVRWLPHAIFHPEAVRDAWLARDETFLIAALNLIRMRAKSVRTLMRNVIRLWPVELAGADHIRKMLNTELSGAASPRLVEWHRRTQEYGLLSADGPRKMAGRLRAMPRGRAELIADAGLTGELAQSRFFAEVHRHVASRLKDDLVAEGFDELQPALELLAPDGQIAFRTQAHLVADALLLPFVQKAAPPLVQQQVRAFLLTHLRDPRLTQTGWASVQPAAKQVMLRWMVDASLEDFFALIGRRAQEDHWRYREAFWSAYRRRGFISDAWVILGENAAVEAMRRWKQAVPASGRLQGGDPNHCVLLLQVGNLVIAEWSHNGTCRVWRRDDPNCPNFYQSWYDRPVLRSNPGYEQRHHASDHYTWQQKLAHVIRQETGITITQSEYRLR